MDLEFVFKVPTLKLVGGVNDRLRKGIFCKGGPSAEVIEVKVDLRLPLRVFPNKQKFLSFFKVNL